MRRWAFVGSGPGADEAFAWLESLADIEAHRAPGLAEAIADAEGTWVHGPAEPAPGVTDWLRAGGRLLCTLEAALLPAALGLEPVAPDRQSEDAWTAQPGTGPLPVRLGLAAFGPHPLFEGLHLGPFLWAPRPGERVRRVGYHRSRPSAARVVGVERAGTAPDPSEIVAWEQEVGAGGILCIGAFVVPDAADPLCRPQLEALLGNAIVGGAIPHEGRTAAAASWPEPGSEAREEEEPGTFPAMPLPGPRPEQDADPLTLETGAADAPWRLAGRRLVALGRVGSGLEEAWAHPVRVLTGARWLEESVSGSLTATPAGARREVTVSGAPIVERWLVPLEQPALVWEIEGGAGRTIGFTMDLRRAWPSPAGAGGALRFSVAPDATVLRVVDASGAQAVVSVEGGRLAARAGMGPTVRAEVTVEGACRIVAVGAVDAADLDRTLAGLARRGVAGLVAQRRQHAEQLRRHGASLHCPDERLSAALEWAKVAMDAHHTGTPGVGRALLAGYPVPDPGRPGRAWYHGPDACWTALGQLAAGARDGPQDLLKFLAQAQDATGRVPHRVSTAGLADLDAADATPLFLLLAGRYAAWTGDLDYLRRWWPALLRAFHHCLACDRDGDGLVDNHRQGHDWARRGPLAATGTSFLLAATWVAALEGLEPLAEALGFSDLASEVADRAAAAREVANRRFRTDAGWSASLDAAGAADPALTALVAVAVGLGAVPVDEAGPALDRLAGDGFTTPWGVRLLDRADPRFVADDPYAGAVSPVLTGWLALAEWRAGRPGSALAHLQANAALPFERSPGAFDAALHGLEHRGVGDCPDHAAAAALTVLPVVEGLWGVRPDALAGAVRVAPWLPPGWDAMRLDRLRVGRTALSVEVRRRPGRLVARVRRTYGPRLHLVLTRADAPTAALTVDEVPLGGEVARFDVEGEHEVIFHDG